MSTECLDGSGKSRDYDIGRICKISKDEDGIRHVLVVVIVATNDAQECIKVERINYRFLKENFNVLMKYAEVKREEELINRYMIIDNDEGRLIVPNVNFIHLESKDIEAMRHFNPVKATRFSEIPIDISKK